MMMEMMDIGEEDEMLDIEESVVVSDYFVPIPNSVFKDCDDGDDGHR